MTDSEIKANWEDNLESLRKERAKKSEQVLHQANSVSLPQFDDAFDEALTNNPNIPASNNTDYIPSPPASATLAEQHTEVPVKSAQAQSGGEDVIEFTIKQEEPIELHSEIIDDETDSLFHTYDKFENSLEVVETIDVGTVEFIPVNPEDYSNTADNQIDPVSLDAVAVESDSIISSLKITNNTLSGDDGYLSSWQKESDTQTETANEFVAADLALSGDVDLSDDSLLAFEPEIALTEAEIVLSTTEQTGSDTPADNEITTVIPTQQEDRSDPSDNKMPVAQEIQGIEVTTFPVEEQTKQNNDIPFVNPSIFSIPIFSIDREDAKKQANQKQEISMAVEEASHAPDDSKKDIVDPLFEKNAQNITTAQQENQASVEAPEVAKVQGAMQELVIEENVKEVSDNTTQIIETEEIILSEAELTEMMDTLLRPVDEIKAVSKENKATGQAGSHSHLPLLEIDPIFTIDEDPEFISQANIHQHFSNNKQTENDSETTVIEINSIYPIEVEQAPPAFTESVAPLPLAKTEEAQFTEESPAPDSYHPDVTNIPVLTDDFLNELAKRLVAPVQEAVLSCLRQELSRQLPEILKETIKTQLKQNPELLNVRKQ